MTDEPELPDPDELAALSAQLPAPVLFGTSSWTYPGWKGLVYHKEYKGRGTAAPMLEEYARFPLFRTVGIDSSFYAPPTDATLEAYASHLPPGFPCVSKVWHEITVHTWTKVQGREKAGERNAHFLDAERFMEAVYQPYRLHFADHMGPFVFEFQAIPAASRGGLAPEEFANELDRFFERLPHDAPYAVEIRNPEFLTPRYFAVLREHGVAHLFNSWTRMPSVGDQLSLEDSVTGRFLVVRALLRPGRTYDEAVDAFAPYDRIQEPLPELRRDLVRLIRTALALRLPAYVIVNNRAEGSAPLTIVAIAKQLIEQMRKDGDR
ncbi:MAG TPA: DUF72 domain-containing protein [Gemmatimonadales bacterium]|nr:DUF72 domain-containing protein [Gemmatimonadales bacterium]